MISFQRGLIDMVLVYWGTSFDWAQMKTQQRWKLPVAIVRAHKRRSSGSWRRWRSPMRRALAYLAETDDDREWVPNPRQPPDAAADRRKALSDLGDVAR